MLPMRLSVLAGGTACALWFASANALAQAFPGPGDPSCSASAPGQACAGSARAGRCEEPRLPGARPDRECVRELRLREERLRDERVHEQRLRDERIHEQRLHDERVHEQRLHDERVHEQRVHDERVREDRLRARHR